MSKDEIHILLKSFSQRPIAYQKVYAQITGSVTAGLLLSQVVYWWYACGEREFYKTDVAWTHELAMGLYELKGAKKKLKSLGLVGIKRKGVPAKSYFTLNVIELVNRISSCGKNPQLDGGKSRNLSGGKAATITKIKAIDHSENTMQEKRVSVEDRLELDLKIVKANKLFMEQVSIILRPRGSEVRTFANIAKHLVDECQADNLPVSIFDDAIDWAKQARASMATNKKGLFVAKIKEMTGFKAQAKMLTAHSMR
jgi:hypothetical protein